MLLLVVEDGQDDGAEAVYQKADEDAHAAKVRARGLDR